MADTSHFSSIPLVAPPNPLDTMRQWQDYSNSQTQNALGVQSVKNAVTAGQTAQTALNANLNADLARESLALANSPAHLQTPDNYRSVIDRKVAMNPHLADIGKVWKAQIKDDSTPDQLRTMATQHASALLDPSLQISLGPTGQIQFINDGQTNIPVQVPGSIARGQGAVPTRQGQGFQNQPSPDSLLAPQVVTVTPEIAQQYGLPPSMIGQTFPVPRGQASPYRGTEGSTQPLPQSGAPNILPMQNPPNGPLGRNGVPDHPALPPGFVIGPDGRGGRALHPTQMPPSGVADSPRTHGQTEQRFKANPPANPYPNGLANGAPPQTTRLPFNALPSGMSTGDTSDIEQNRQAYRVAQANAATLPIANTQYIEAHNLIADLKDSDFTTGIGSGRANRVRQLLVQLGAREETVANVDKAATAEKLLSKAIADKGPATDAGRDLLAHANPSLAMPPGATLPIIRQIVANNRATQAVLESAPDKTGAGFLRHQSEMARKLNTPEGLKALAWDMTPEAEQSRIIKDLRARGGDAMANFEYALNIGHHHKVMGR